MEVAANFMFHVTATPPPPPPPKFFDMAKVNLHGHLMHVQTLSQRAQSTKPEYCAAK